MRLPEGLPELQGRWLAAYKLLWGIMLAVAIVGSTAGNLAGLATGRAQDRVLYGAGVRMELNTAPFTFAPIGPQTRATGMVAGSELLSVDGRPVVGGSDEGAVERLVAALDGRPGQVMDLTMRAPDGTVAVHRVTRGPHHLAAADREAPVPYETRMAFNAIALFAVSGLAVLAASLLFLRRKHDPVVALLSLALLTFTGNVDHLIANPGLREWVAWALGTVAGATLFLAVATFPTGRFQPRISLVVLGLLPLNALLTLPAIPVPPSVSGAVVTTGLAVLIAILALRYFRLPPGVQRQQMKWAVFGFAVLMVCMIVSFALSQIDRSAEDNWLHFALLFGGRVIQFAGMAAFVAGILISLLRHRLYDADAAISRSALYGGLTVALVAIFAGFEKLIETLGEEWFGGSAGAAAGAIAAALAALFLVPLHHRMSRWAEGRFQKDITAMRARLPELLAELRDSENPRELADDALRLAIVGVRASHGAITLAAENGQMLADAQGIGWDAAAGALAQLPAHPEPGLERLQGSAFALRMPLLTPSGTLAGWLLLGPHPDGSFYGKDDREALEEIASPLARALAIALERARRAEDRRAETHALRETLDAVAQRLAEIAERIAPPPRRPRKAQTIN